MKTLVTISLATVTCLAASLAGAQAQENPIFIYSTYYRCDTMRVKDADHAVTQTKPDLDGMVGNGTVSSWSWLAKNVGGEWTRVGFVTGSSLGTVINAAYKYGVTSEGHPPKPGFVAACGSGEDYVWRVIAGNNSRGRRGTFAFSTYYVCDQSREDQADALVKSVVGPTYDKMISDNKLMTWIWAEQIIGGKYRRLASMTAETMDDLAAARELLVAGGGPLDKDMISICGTHQDIIWETLEQGGR